MKVLFICTLNAVRSPMAKYLARYIAPDNEYYSAGITKGPQDYFAVEVMQEIGIDMSKYEPQSLEELNRKDFDLVICLADQAKEEAEKFASGNCKFEFWDIPSPGYISGSRFAKLFGYRDIRDRLKTRIRQHFLT